MAGCHRKFERVSSRRLLIAVIVGLYVGCTLPGVVDAQQALSPQCISLDALIEHIVQSMQSMPATAVICAKIPGCTGIRCSINVLGQNVGISLRMYPCGTPPQMRIRIFIPSSGINFSQMITHGTTIALPGFQYSPMPGIRVQAQVSVNFQKVPEGLLLGLWFQAKGFGTGISWPIVPDYVIVFPPCTGAVPTTPAPPQSQCGKMNSLISNIPPPPGFKCSAFQDCLGFHCFGSINAVVLTYSVNVSLTINHCDVPVSYTVSFTNPGTPFLWQHTFYKSATVPVSANFPGDTTVKLQVVMRHNDPEGYIKTSIKVIVCLNVVGCFDMSFMSSELVPIPPCVTNNPMPLSEYLPPVPAQQVTTPECIAWQRVENSLKNIAVPGLRVSYCYIELPQCNHIMCTAEYNGQTPPATSTSYSIYMEVKHCIQPMTMFISVRGVNNDFVMEQALNADTNVTLNRNGVLLYVHFKVFNGAIQLRASIIIPQPGKIAPLNLPLVNDQIIPLPNCAAEGNPSNPGGFSPGGGGAEPFYPTSDHKPWVPDTGGRGHNDATKPPSATSPIDKKIPEGNAESKNNAVPVALGILFTSLVIIGAAFGAFYWYRYRRIPS